MIFVGNATLVGCAEEKKRYDECSNLLICVEGSTTHFDYIKSAFPSNVYAATSSFSEILEWFSTDMCNVIAAERSTIIYSAMIEGISNGTYTLGNKTFTKEPLAVVTRNNDRKWTDVVNWVVRALLFGEEHGLMQNSSLCHINESSVVKSSQLNFLNAVYCVGNYGELLDKNFQGPYSRSEINKINNGTAMLYATPFGEMQNMDEYFDNERPGADTTFGKIKDSRVLYCGVVESGGYSDDDIVESTNLTGMGVDYCYTLAAAIFNGDFKSANIVPLPDIKDISFMTLINGTVDVIAGGRVDANYGSEKFSSLGKYIFSTPYYYGHNSV